MTPTATRAVARRGTHKYSVGTLTRRYDVAWLPRKIDYARQTFAPQEVGRQARLAR